jgi:hypothetical protein
VLEAHRAEPILVTSAVGARMSRASAASAGSFVVWLEKPNELQYPPVVVVGLVWFAKSQST